MESLALHSIFTHATSAYIALASWEPFHSPPNLRIYRMLLQQVTQDSFQYTTQTAFILREG